MTDSMVPAILERVAKLEVHVSDLKTKVSHIDVCVDDLKQTIWRASGAVALAIATLNGTILVIGWWFGK